jgi:thiaminase
VYSSIVVEKLKQTCVAEWNLLLDYNNNKFIAEMANDSLPVEKFIFYLKQDHAFLKEFCSSLLRLRDAVEDPSLKTWFEGLHRSTEQHEMVMQKQLLVSLGLSEEDIETMVPAGVTKNYISFLRKISASTSIEERVSARINLEMKCIKDGLNFMPHKNPNNKLSISKASSANFILVPTKTRN